MPTLTILLSDGPMERLRELAGRLGVPTEQLARAGLEDWLRRPRKDFEQTTARVLAKNAELYRRLA